MKKELGCYDIPKSNDAYYVSLLANALDYTTGYFDTYVLADYDNAQLQVTFWDGYWGSASCSWVYRGKYDSIMEIFFQFLAMGIKTILCMIMENCMHIIV